MKQIVTTITICKDQDPLQVLKKLESKVEKVGGQVFVHYRIIESLRQATEPLCYTESVATMEDYVGIESIYILGREPKVNYGLAKNQKYIFLVNK